MPEVQNFFITSCFRPHPTITSPTSTHLDYSGLLDTWPYNLIAVTSGLALLLLITRTLAGGGVIIFVRQGQFFFELSISSTSLLDFFSDYVGSTFFEKFFFAFQTFTLLPQGYYSRSDFFFPSVLLFFRSFCYLRDFSCHYLLCDSGSISRPSWG